MYTVYLAGAMEYAPDGGTTWRNSVAEKLKQAGIKYFDPASNEHGLLEKFGATDHAEFLSWKKTDLQKFSQCMQEIIHYDMDAIDELDSILVYLTRGLSGGTIGEITHAYRNLMIPVIAVLEPGLRTDEVSGWVLGCCDMVCTDFDSAVEFFSNHKKIKESLDV